MKVSIDLNGNEVREAILEYLKTHRPDFIAPEIDTPPTITFKWNTEGLGGEKLTAVVQQEFPVHHGAGPYR